jgi:protein-L-isoaspartate(D-aspartate) O-methyltransferase
MLDALDIQADDLVLDLGCGLGYSSAVIARIAEAVVAVEENEDWLDDAQTVLTRVGADNVALQGGALAAGAAEYGPYDVIILQGAAEFVPDAILDQLKEGGRIAALIAEGALGIVKIGYKIDGVMSWRFAFNAGAPVLPGFERHRAFTL